MNAFQQLLQQCSIQWVHIFGGSIVLYKVPLAGERYDGARIRGVLNYASLKSRTSIFNVGLKKGCSFWVIAYILVIMALRLTSKQIEENRLQQNLYYRQKNLIEQWQREIGIRNITKLGSKQFRKKQRQLQRQARNRAIELRKKDSTKSLTVDNNVGCNMTVNDPTLGRIE